MFRKILFPTDFSEGAMRAIKRFEEKNDMDGRECILLHVIDEGHIEDLMNGYSFLYSNEEREYEEIVKMAKKNAIKKLKEREEKCKEMMKARKIRSAVRVGIPYEEIVKFAEEENVSLILMSSHGKLGYSHELIGSTTIRVLIKSKKPLLIIKTHRGD